MKKNFFLCLALLSSLETFPQQKIRTIAFSDTIISTAVDRTGDFYFITKEGQIQKFDKDGKLIILFKHHPAPTLFEARDGARLFAYYRGSQQYEYYNPSFEITSSYRVDSAFAIKPWLICTSGEHKLWVLDAADHSLKKIDVQQTQVEVEVLIDAGVIRNENGLTTMREYQGYVFLLNPRKGIYIFNSLGKHIKTIEEKGIDHFDFLGEELYFLTGSRIEFFNLFTGETRYIDVPETSGMILLTDERMVTTGDKSVDIFEYRP